MDGVSASSGAIGNIPFSLAIHSSVVPRLLHLVAGLLAISAISLSTFSLSLKFWLVVLLISVHCHYWNGLGRPVFGRIVFRQGQSELLHHKQKPVEAVSVVLKGDQLVLPWLIILRFREEKNNRVHVISLWFDSADRDELRKLRVLLRWSF